MTGDRGGHATIAGRVLAVHSAFCRVSAGGRVLKCSFRGRLRKSDEVFPGDLVEVVKQGEAYVVEELLPRKNLLVRPHVANVDQAIVVSAATRPPAELAYIDKVLIHLESREIGAVLCFNKCDVEERQRLEDLARVYRSAGYPCVITSAVTCEGIDQLHSYLNGRLTILAGTSGVGKSKILSRLLEIDIETGTLSRVGRGRHTTKGVTLYSVKGEGFLADTPGFSKIDLLDARPEELAYLYREFAEYAPRCHYPRCLHRTEDKCAVREALAQGIISSDRYRTYLTLLDEALEKEKHRYDRS